MATKYSVFTKPWKKQTADELAELVAKMGFDGVEFPLRDGYQAEPKEAVSALPKLAELFDKYNLKIYSVASGLDEHIFEACAIAKVPLIRVMASYPDGYKNGGEDKMVKILAEALPLCEKYGIKVGVQQHYGKMSVSGTMELVHLLEKLDKRYIGAVWDAAHSALAGEFPEQALEICADYLFLANFKSAFYRRMNGPDAECADFQPYFTTGRNCQFPWKNACDTLKKIGYSGVICMPAEYNDETNLIAKATEDLKYLKSLMD